MKIEQKTKQRLRILIIFIVSGLFILGISIRIGLLLGMVEISFGSDKGYCKRELSMMASQPRYDRGPLDELTRDDVISMNCRIDYDNDGFVEAEDNCPDVYNSRQFMISIGRNLVHEPSDWKLCL